MTVYRTATIGKSAHAYLHSLVGASCPAGDVCVPSKVKAAVQVWASAKKKKKKMWRTNLPDCIQHTHTQTHTRNDMKQWFKCVSTGRWRGPESQWSVAVPSLAFTISGECEYKWHLLSINHDHFGGANTPPQKKTWRKKALGDFRRAQKHVLNGQCQFRRKTTKNDAIFFFFPDGGTHTKCFKSVMRILQGITQKSALICQRACAENAFSPVMGIQQEI